MQAKAITPADYALMQLRHAVAQLNDMLYGTHERAQRSISLAFLALVLLQVYGFISGSGGACAL